MRGLELLEKRLAAMGSGLEREMAPCAECGERGWWDAPELLCGDCAEAKIVAAALAGRRANWSDSLARIGVPRAYSAVPATMDLPPSCAKWRGTPWAVTILGPTGAGKTWVGIRLLAELYCSGLEGRFVDAPAILDRVKAEMSGEQTRDRGLFGQLVKAEALLLDDVSAVRDTDYQRDRLVLLLRERYNAQRPTILTSNKLTLADLATSHLDAPIGSRLAAGIVVAIKGKDRRLS